MSKHTETYRIIKAQLDRNPELKVAALCKIYNASYSGYRYWSDKQDAEVTEKELETKPKESRPTNPSKVFIPIELDRVVQAVLSGEVTIPMPVDKLLNDLSSEQLRAIAVKIGQKHMDTFTRNKPSPAVTSLESLQPKVNN